MLWLLWGSSKWGIMYSKDLQILMLCAHFKRFTCISLLQILSPDLSLVSSKSLAVQSSLWLVSMNHCWFVALAISPRQLEVRCLVYCYWEDFPSPLFFRITSQWDSNTWTMLLNSVSILCRIMREPGWLVSPPPHIECHTCDGGKRSNVAGVRILGTWTSWTLLVPSGFV